MAPIITTTITCVKCGGSITGGDKQYLVVCPYCGVEYQLSISAVVVDHIDIEEKIKTLVACATDGNQREQAEACLELAKLNDARVVAPAIAAYNTLSSRMDDYQKNQPAILALGDIIKNISDPAASKVLIEIVKDTKNGARQLAIFALRNIGDPSSTDTLIEVARDPDQYIRCASLEALGRIKDARIPAILMAALDDKNYHVKRSAIVALGDLRYAAAGERILGIFKNYSETATDSGMPWVQVRWWAAHALGQLAYEPAVKPLIKALNDNDMDLRKAADAALMYISGASRNEELKGQIKKARDEFAKENSC
ncbi:MAG: HEAT repeat domain-containing protein [Spirochaetes bacterium]|nr:HEAT repeat domain-containing protein [Spirochaetota bacterium]